MSEQINIQLELETVLKAIENDERGILAQIIKKLLMADYEGFKQINELGNEITGLKTDIKFIISRLDIIEEEEELVNVIENEEEEELEVVELEDADESK